MPSVPHSGIINGWGGETPRVLGRQLPPPPSPLGASGQQLVAKGAGLRSPCAKGARHSMGTKGAQRTFLSTLHPNTILKPNPDPNAHPNPMPPNPTPTPSPDPHPSPSSNPRLGSKLVLGSKMESNNVTKSSHQRNFGDHVQPNQHGWHGRTSWRQRLESA